MAIKVIMEFVDKATVRVIVYVKDDDDKLTAPTSVLVSIIEPDGPRSGVATALSANHLIDTTKNQFVAADVGKTVYNTTDKTTAVITDYTSPSDVTLDADIMAEGEGYEIYCVYAEDIVVTGKVENGVYEYYYHKGEDAEPMDPGQWRGKVAVVDGAGTGAIISPGSFSFKVR